MCYSRSTSLVETIKKYIPLFFFIIAITSVLYSQPSYFFNHLSSVLETVSSALLGNKAYARELDESNEAKLNRCTKYCEYEVVPGDNLSKIFKKLKIKQASALVKKLDEADAELLHIDTIRPGYILRFWLTKDRVDKFEMEINVAKKIQYKRDKNGLFQAEEINIEGDWVESVALGTVKSNFFISATSGGMLTSNEYQNITQIFKDKINFARDLHPGDTFKVIYKAHMVDDKESGQTEILAVHFQLKKKTVSAYLHKDGNYYDEKGESLQSTSFLLYPLEKKARISSHFNPSRIHPVTGRVAPHNGTDFAIDIGTPVVAAADGIVSIVRNHPYAGKYIVIDHGSKYKTRYLHNNELLVKKGQKVSKGQRIALSGRTGRVSGAHLHYEVLVNGKPVDAMKADFLPMSSTVPSKDMKAFKKMVSNFQDTLQVRSYNKTNS